MNEIPNVATILMIAGYGRSGSTLLDRLLGQMNGFVSTGEICHIWERCFLEGQLCGCGRPFPNCDFWAQVQRSGFGGAFPDASSTMRLQRKVARLGSLPCLMWPCFAPVNYRRSLALYQRDLHQLFRGITMASGARVIVDSSKDPLHGLVLTGIDRLDLRVIHLVRDPRAVAYSWMRKRIRPEVHWETQHMPVFPPTRSSLVWNIKNQLVEGLMSRVKYSTRIRYEDLLSDPAEVLEKALVRLGLAEPVGGFGFIQARTALLSVDHTVAGNPMRFKSGSLVLRKDEEWRDQMSSRHRRYVTALTWPWLRRYGYQ